MFKNRFIKIPIHFGLLFCFIVGLSITGCKDKETKAQPLPEAIKVIAQKVTQIKTQEKIYVTGSLEADKTSQLSFQVPGKVERIFVEEGDPVKKGQILASLEKNDFHSNYNIAKANLLKAQDAYNRYKPLYKQGAFSEKNFTELSAGLIQAKAGRDIARKKLKDTELRAPIDGIIGRKSLEIGQMIAPSVPVFIIVKTDTIKARVSVPAQEIALLALGQKAKVAIPALSENSFLGKVSMIGVMADTKTRTYPVEIQLNNQDLILRAGMIAQVTITSDKKIDLVTIPGQAIIRDPNDLTYVFKTDKNSQMAILQRVLVGGIYNNEIQIIKGLKPNDQVIIFGQHKLEDGNLISVSQTHESGRAS